jgi:hypothetical protein
VFNEGNISVPYVDCAAIHMEAIVQAALDGRDE